MLLAELTPELTQDECKQFHQNGWLGPFELLPRDEMLSLSDECFALLDEDESGHHNNGHNRHLDNEHVARFAKHPNVVNRVASLLGDVMLWRTNFFCKLPGGKEIPWHQDFNYWPLEPAVVVSAWLAVDDVTIENSAPQFIPGSHVKQVPHIKAPPEMQFGEMADPAYVDTSKAIDMELKAGQFILFNERTLHHSFANTSSLRRFGCALRYIHPCSRVTDYDIHGPQPHRLELVAGEDKLQFNQMVD